MENRMNRSRSRGIAMIPGSLLLLLFLATALPARAQNNGGRKTLGIMPVFDASGEEYGELFAQSLTAMEFRKLAGAPFDVVLLNPGGLYNPLIPESIVDYAQAANVNTVLIMSF